MAEKKRLLDVWIVELKTVYREVPFAVVTDWLQQGRLLAEDRVRLSGTTAWRAIQDVSALATFLPRAEPLQAEDQAEALEPVELGLSWRHPKAEEDEDVDMIPLIDISLVLLIFFMMTAAVSSGFFSPIQTPGAKYQQGEISKDMYWVGIDIKNQDGKMEKGPDGKPLPWYALGRDSQNLHPPTPELAEVLFLLEQNLDKNEGEVKIRIRADRTLPIETIKGVTLELQGLEGRLNRQRALSGGKGRVGITIFGEVSEPQNR